MFGFGKKRSGPDSADEKAPTAGLFERLTTGLGKTRNNLFGGLGGLFAGRRQIDEELLDDIETQLLSADVGIRATERIMQNLSDEVDRRSVRDPEALRAHLQTLLKDLLLSIEQPLNLPEKRPFVILVVGVNGVGKTTTIGKLAHQFRQEGRSVMLAAGDTFRAAAVEQLQAWGERNQVPVIAQHTGADSASVVYDAVQAAMSRGTDILIADTAGRLHNKENLMQELAKVRRVMQKLLPEAPHETLLVLDAGTGQNALSQTREFHSAVDLSGLVLTKLDGTAKGGIIFALAEEFGLPLRYIGVGESAEDLQPFSADAFARALFPAADTASESRGDQTTA